MVKSIIDIVIDKNDIANIAAGFRQFNFGLQKKYLHPAVRDAIKSKVPSLKAATPRRSGGLRASSGYVASKPKSKGNPQKYGVKVLGRIGYRRGKTAKGTKFKGNHAILVEDGVAAQNGKVFKIEWAKNRKYQYLKGMRARKNPYVFLAGKRRVSGAKFFASWWNRNRKQMMRTLKANMQDALVKTKAEAARRARAKQIKALGR